VTVFLGCLLVALGAYVWLSKKKKKKKGVKTMIRFSRLRDVPEEEED
jgi:putative copper export protein